jgi:hypothetical protein
MPHARFAGRDCEHFRHRRMELSHREQGPLTMLHPSFRSAVFSKCGSAALLERVNPAFSIVLMFHEGDRNVERIGHGVVTLPASPISEDSPLLAYYPDPVSPLRVGPGKSMPNVPLLV